MRDVRLSVALQTQAQRTRERVAGEPHVDHQRDGRRHRSPADPRRRSQREHRPHVRLQEQRPVVGLARQRVRRTHPLPARPRRRRRHDVDDLDPGHEVGDAVGELGAVDAERAGGTGLERARRRRGRLDRGVERGEGALHGAARPGDLVLVDDERTGDAAECLGRDGLALVTGRRLLRGVVDARRPAGELVVVDTSGANDVDPGFAEIGGPGARFVLMYVTAAEMAA